MKNSILYNSDTYSNFRKRQSQPSTTARTNLSQTHLIQTVFKTPEKSRIFRQKTPSTKVKVKTQNIENKENETKTINKNNYSKISNRQTQEKQTSNLMKQINEKLNQKSVSVPDILQETKENNEIKLFGQTNQQGVFTQNRVIKIQDLFTQNQITIKELERNWQAQLNQESELIKSLQNQESIQQSRNDSKENLLNSLIHQENSTGHKPLIYVIDLALL
ncbi:unnamed protein product [Paramecium primaurelia]|uniref:Uncharacterized protein n=1 Tax=Paramecium primaurelia TaxID=5886 RepID=A0A8S1N1V7_PARPR|nr:unnamed protein product [Paramecium primaurelia]